MPRLDLDARCTIAAHDIRVLLQGDPGRLLFHPRARIWALALLNDGRSVLALDGALRIATAQWPGHYDEGALLAPELLAARLREILPLPSDKALSALSIPGQRCGRCCLILHGNPCLVATQALQPCDPQARLQILLAPQEGPADRLPTDGPSPLSLDELLARVAVPERADRLTRRRLWHQAVAAERQRLAWLDRPVPPWLRGELSQAIDARL